MTIDALDRRLLEPRNLLDALTIAACARHTVLYSAISAGFVGVSFSPLIGLRQRLAASTLDELRNTQRLAFLLTRAFIGAGAGEGGVARAALLILRCFISGSCEQFVPSLLMHTEARVEGSAKPADGEAKPPG